MKFRPLHDRVVIRRAEGDLKSQGGIIIPDRRQFVEAGGRATMPGQTNPDRRGAEACAVALAA